PGIAPALADYMAEDIARLKRTADFVIVSVHWGVEYAAMPDAAQVARAHAAIDAGADVVLGHHPHVLQPFEAYKEGLIFYSLGNFVFDQKKSRTTESMVALISLKKGRRPEAELIPYRISDSRPAPMGSQEGNKLLKDLAERSSRLGTRVDVLADRAYLTTDGRMASSFLGMAYPGIFKSRGIVKYAPSIISAASPTPSSVP
ncbi:MAG TPA: CapA family protein, partial [Bacillota bacterium]|nr:CapA family protein [Bacillota bacterium]